MYVDGVIPYWAICAHRLRQVTFELYCAAVILVCIAGMVMLHTHTLAGRILIGRVLPIALAVLLFWPAEG